MRKFKVILISVCPKILSFLSFRPVCTGRQSFGRLPAQAGNLLKVSNGFLPKTCRNDKFGQALISCCLVVVFIGVVFAQESLTVKASNSMAFTRTLYTVEFIASETIHSNASFEIVFPKEYILTNKILAGSRTLNGGLKTSVVGDTVVVSRTGLGSSVPAGTKVDIMLSDIINPGKEGDSYQLTLRLKSDRNAVHQ